MRALPTPRLTATITPPTRKGDLGAVVVHGCTPPHVDLDEGNDRPRPRPSDRTRQAGVCSLCRLPGHARSNRKFHPIGAT